MHEIYSDFIAHIYSLKKGEPIPTNRLNKLGTLIENQLTAPPTDYNPRTDEGNIIIRLPVFASVNVTSRNYLSRRAKAAVCRRLKDDFDVCFIGYMQRRYKERNRINRKVYIIEIIEDFCQDYHICMTGENIDLLKKKYYRYIEPMTPRRQKK